MKPCYPQSKSKEFVASDDKSQIVASDDKSEIEVASSSECDIQSTLDDKSQILASDDQHDTELVPEDRSEMEFEFEQTLDSWDSDDFDEENDENEVTVRFYSNDPAGVDTAFCSLWPMILVVLQSNFVRSVARNVFCKIL